MFAERNRDPNVLMAAGRAVNTENIGLKECGIALTDRGFIKVDKNLQTSAAGYYAIGDVAGPPMLAHKGSREGVVVAELIAGQKPHPIKYDNVPSVTYCHPEVASIGLTEDQCKEQKLDYVAGKFPFSASGRARGTGETEGFVKILRDKQYGEILGAHIVGSHASELIHELGAVVVPVVATRGHGIELMADGKAVLKARRRAAPSEGEANTALLRLIAKTLDVPRRDVALAAGATARVKRLVISGDGPTLIAALEKIASAR